MKQSFNPKWAQLALTYDAVRSDMATKNPFLADIIEQTRERFKNYRGHFGYHEAKAMFRGFEATGAVEYIKGMSDFDKHAELFWQLCDYFKQEQKDGIGTRGLNAVRVFYHDLNKRKVFSETFAKADKSPLDHLKRGDLSVFLKGEFENSEDTFIINYQKEAKTYLLALNFKSKTIQHAALKAIEISRRRSERCKDDMVIAKESESWFGERPEEIQDYTDFNARRLVDAMDIVRSKYEGKRLLKAMNFLFDMYAALIREHPKYDFFKDSYLWNSQIVLDQRVPIQMCHGYKMVVMGRESNLPGYEKILFCANNMDRLSANGHRFGMHACDLSSIKTEYYRMILVNYGAAKFSVGIDRACTFFKWLELKKERCSKHGVNFKSVSIEETAGYRAYVTQRLHQPESRNRLLGGAKTVIHWAASMGYLDVEKGAMEDFSLFKTIYHPNQRCLSRQELDTLEASLEELGKTDVRCFLALHIFRIQLFVDTRAGEICSISLNRLRFKQDGTSTYISTYESLEKNAGKEMVKIRYSKAATKVILEAIDATKEIRSKCPIDGPGDCLFLYDAGETWGHGFKVMVTDTYNSALAKACEYAGIEKITSGNIRDTYMTAVARFGHKHGLTELQKAVLTKHATKVSTRHYVDINLDEFLRASDGIVLGTIKHGTSC